MKQETLAKLKQKVAEAKNYINIVDIPKGKLKLKLGEADFKTDKFQQECFFANLTTEDGKIIVQKYPRSTYDHLFSKLEATGIDKLSSGYTLWQMETVGKAREPRLFPVA